MIRRARAGQEAAHARDRNGGWPKWLSPYYKEIAPMFIGAYKQERSIRDIMKAFKIPSTATLYKIVSETDIKFQDYKNVKTTNN